MPVISPFVRAYVIVIRLIFYFDFFYSDDACHLGPYVKNVLEKHDTELTRYFTDRKLEVDFLHSDSMGWFISINL